MSDEIKKSEDNNEYLSNKLKELKLLKTLGLAGSEEMEVDEISKMKITFIKRRNDKYNRNSKEENDFHGGGKCEDFQWEIFL